MKVRLLAFATARDALGQDELELELPDGSTLAEVVTLLEAGHPDLAKILPRLALAVDGAIAGEETTLKDGSEVALLPPVSGGSREERVALVDAPIDLPQVEAVVADPACGAIVLFVGTVRDRHSGRSVKGITYEAYRPMAIQALAAIAADLESETPPVRVNVVHRLGDIPVGEASVAIAVASPHRDLAFETCRLALERLKKEVPIWKLEHYADGDSAWREEEPLARSVPNLV